MRRARPILLLLLSSLLAAPLLWTLLQFCLHLLQLQPGRFLPGITRLTLITLTYDLLASLIALALAIPPALAIARMRNPLPALMLLLLAFAQPPIIHLYGWSQFFRLTGLLPEPQSAADIFRCIWTLSCWLWPIPAAALGLALRHLDRDLLDAAALDGAQRHITARQVFPAATGAFCITLALALQQFTVFDQTNIPVVATEVRSVFATGSFAGQELASPGSDAAAQQDMRIAAAALIALPSTLLTLVTFAFAAGILRKSGIGLDIEQRPTQRCCPSILPSVAILALTLGTPLISMLFALGRVIHPAHAISALLPQLAGSFFICGVVALIATALGLLAMVVPLTVSLGVSLIAFLVGGQLLALGAIHLLNRPLFFALYDSPVGVILVHLSLFAWVNLLIARQFFAGHWAQLRLASAADGASSAQMLWRILLPATWRWHLAGGIMVFCLSLGETSAVMILQPPRPQMLTPTLMTWVHMLRYDDMIEGALLLSSIIMLAVLLVALLSWRRVLPLLIAGLLLVSGCGPSDKPDAVWGPPGTGPHTMIYPRGIAYAAAADEFFVVDRAARIQHLDHNGVLINEWQMPEQANGKPVGITIGPDGNVYLPDTHYHRVMVYSPDGELLRQWGSEGRAPGQFIFPTDIAFDSEGNIFVSEYGDNDRIQVFSPAGQFLYQFGHFGQGDGEFSRPQSMVIDGDTLYVTDACNHRINVFTTKGKFIRNMGQSGSAPGQFRFPYGLDDDGKGNLLVTEFGNNRVQKIAKSDGHPIATWGTTGRAEGELAYPWAAVIDKRGRAIIVDSGNNRLQVVSF